MANEVWRASGYRKCQGQHARCAMGIQGITRSQSMRRRLSQKSNYPVRELVMLHGLGLRLQFDPFSLHFICAMCRCCSALTCVPVLPRTYSFFGGVPLGKVYGQENAFPA